MIYLYLYTCMYNILYIYIYIYYTVMNTNNTLYTVGLICTND